MMHPDDELHEALDDRLGAGKRAELEEHLAICDRCRTRSENLRLTREAVGQAAGAEAPPELRARVLAALDAEDLGSGAAEAEGHRPRRWRLGVSLAATVVLGAAGAALFLGRHRTDPPHQVARDFIHYRAGTESLAFTTADVGEMERYFRSVLPFRARVLDLVMMKYRLAGGSVKTLAARPSALFAYRSEDGAILVCEMLQGDAAELARGGVSRENAGISFHVHRVGAVTLAFWQEGVLTCVLASDIDPETLVQLAFAKAMKAGISGPSPRVGRALPIDQLELDYDQVPRELKLNQLGGAHLHCASPKPHRPAGTERFWPQPAGIRSLLSPSF